MRELICIAVVAALVFLTGCAKPESEPAPAEPEAAVEQPTEESQPITSEDFESGEVEELEESGDEDADEDAEPTE